MRETIGTRELQSLIGVDKARLRFWLDRGIFGKDKVGVGPGRAGRQFTLAEALLARCLRDFLDFTGTKGGMLREGEVLDKLREAVQFALRTFHDVRFSDHGAGLQAWVILMRERSGFRLVYMESMLPDYPLIRRKAGGACTFLALPVHDICKEIRRYFEKAAP